MNKKLENFINKAKKVAEVGFVVGTTVVPVLGENTADAPKTDGFDKTGIDIDKTQKKGIENIAIGKITQEEIDKLAGEGEELEGGEGGDELTIQDMNDFTNTVDTVKNDGKDYGFDEKGYKELVGEIRVYFGSVPKERSEEFFKWKAEGPFVVDMTNADRLVRIGDVYEFTGLALFADYGPDGTAHLTLLSADTLVFIRDGKTYVPKCGNQVRLISKGKKEPLPVKKEVKEVVNKNEKINSEQEENVWLVYQKRNYYGNGRTDWITLTKRMVTQKEAEQEIQKQIQRKKHGAFDHDLAMNRSGNIREYGTEYRYKLESIK